MTKPLALVIDDEPDICELLGLTLGRMDIETEMAADVATAKAALGKHTFDICLTDMRLPDGDGLELVEWMQTNAPGIPVAVITAHGNVETAVQALKLGAFDFISKPLDLGNLRNIVENAVDFAQSKVILEAHWNNEDVAITVIDDGPGFRHCRCLISRRHRIGTKATIFRRVSRRISHKS